MTQNGSYVRNVAQHRIDFQIPTNHAGVPEWSNGAEILLIAQPQEFG